MFIKDNLGKTEMNSTSTTTGKHQPHHCIIFPSSFFFFFSVLIFFFFKEVSFYERWVLSLRVFVTYSYHAGLNLMAWGSVVSK